MAGHHWIGFTRQFNASTIRSFLYFSLAFLFMIGGAVQAQDDVSDQDESEADEILEEVVITGSRIERSGMVTPTPVTMVDMEELDYMAPGSMIEGISVLPQFYGNETLGSPENWFLRGGYGLLNLRGLGTNRTLTLLSGRRMISSTAFGGVDINVFPEAVIRSVETVTGGASAAYGTDAVAGVVNFILDTEFVGWDAHAQYGTTSRSDADNWEASIAFGAELGDEGQGHVLIAADAFELDGVHSYEGRDWYRAWGTLQGPNGQLLVRPNVVSRNASFDGLISAPGSSLHQMQFSPDGSISPFVDSDQNSIFPFGIPPARQSITNGGSGDDLASQRAWVHPDAERKNLFLYGDWDFGDNVTVFAQYIHGENETWRYNSPGGSFHGTPTALTIFQDNAFLPENVRQTMIDEGLESFTFKRMGSFSDFQPKSLQWDESEMDSFTVGVDWDIDTDGFFDGWSVNAYYQRGTNERKWYQNGLRVDRIFAAVDAVRDPSTGEIVCRVSLYGDAFPGCVPINLFGQGNASAAAIDYLTGNDPGVTITTPIYFADTGYDLGVVQTYTTQEAKVNNTDIDQDLFEISANGPISEGWGAGSIDLAVGYSYRKEEILQIVHDQTNPAADHSGGFHPVSCNNPEIGLRGVSSPDCANTVGFQYSKVSNIMGEIDVSEVFAETYIPLIQGAEAMEQMTMSLAARWADYEGSGSIWAYKGGLDMQFTSDFRIRATYSRDVRAANLSERFDKTGGAATISDPQFGNEFYTVTQFSGGNPNVEPEEADTVTMGFVYQPSQVEGLSIALDWYDIDIDGAIGQLGVQAMVDQCEAGAAAACALVTRDVNSNRVILVGNIYINVDRAIARGLDLEVTYKRDVDWFGDKPQYLSARLFATYLDERSEQQEGAPKIDRAGQTGIEQNSGDYYALPDFKLTGFVNYNWGPWDVFLQGRYIDSGTTENALVEGVDIDDNSVDSAFYADFTLRYMHEFDNGNLMELFGSVINLTDKDPPVTPRFDAFYGYAQQTNSSMFDLLGRRYTAGVRMRFF